MSRKIALTAILAAWPATADAQDPFIAAGDSGDTAWLLAATALALLALLTGLALYYGSRTRAANLPATLLQLGAVTAVTSLLWVLTGYTLAFGETSGGWIGNGRAWMLIDLGATRSGTSVPESTFALFRMAFALIAPALMIGAWAERARFSFALVFCALWGLVVFSPVTHWAWGGGWLAALGVHDFAGGLVLLTTAGVSALAVTLLLGRRLDFSGRTDAVQTPTLSLLGASLIWIGWFALIGGSALSATDDASTAILNAHMAACTSALLWLLIERIRTGGPTMAGFAKGALAGLAAISPAAVYISPGAAVLFGAAAALGCYAAIGLVKTRLQIDDAMDIFALFGVSGMLGTLLLAVFISPTFGGTGLPEGTEMLARLIAQATGIAAVAIYSAVASTILALGISLFLPMRVSEAEERAGLPIGKAVQS